MSAGFFPNSEDFPVSTPEDGGDVGIAEWCSLHRLIEQLSAIQRRLGTPLEEPEDFLRVRSLGSTIKERLVRFANDE